MPLRIVAALSIAALLASPVDAGAQDAARFYAERADEYSEERRAIRTSRQKVERIDGVLRIRLDNGAKREFIDTIAEGDRHIRFLYAGYLPVQRIHAIEVHLYEGSYVEVLHALTGQDTVVVGRPRPSPDGTRFVASSFDLVAGYDPNILEIWRVGREGMVQEFVLDGGDKWGPDSVRWIGNNTIRFSRVTLNGAELLYGHAPRSVRRVGTTWAADSSRR